MWILRYHRFSGGEGDSAASVKYHLPWRREVNEWVGVCFQRVEEMKRWGFMMMKMAVTLQQSELLKAVTRHLIVVMVDSWLTRPRDPWCIYRNGAQLVRSFSGLIAM